MVFHYSMHTQIANLLILFKAKFLIIIMPYFSLARGFLSGKYRSEADLGKSVRDGGVKPYLNEKGFAVLKALNTVSAKHNSKPATVALA